MRPMRYIISLALLTLCATVPFLLSLGTAAETPQIEELGEVIKKLESLHKRLAKPQPGEWLDQHKEPGQSFAHYVQASPVTPRGERKILYIQPVGAFTKAQNKIVKETAEYMGIYFGVKVTTLKSLDLSVVPESKRRKNPYSGQDQLLSTYILRPVLTTRLPKDGLAIIALTATDLWPGKGWNFVFGQAALRERVGVWSIARFGSPDTDEEAYKLCLLRALKVATHETGHMLSIPHCIAWSCNMNGSNSMSESDRKELWCCPECMAKLCWAAKMEPGKRYLKLAAFCKLYELNKEHAFFTKSAAATGGKEELADKKTPPVKEAP